MPIAPSAGERLRPQQKDEADELLIVYRFVVVFSVGPEVNARLIFVGSCVDEQNAFRSCNVELPPPVGTEYFGLA